MGHATMLSSQPDVTDVAMSSEQVLLNPVPTRLCHGDKKDLRLRAVTEMVPDLIWAPRSLGHVMIFM